VILIKLNEFIDYLFERYKQDKEFGAFLKDSGLIEVILRKRKVISQSEQKNKVPASKTNMEERPVSKPLEDTTEIEISNSDGFSKIIFEDLKKKRVLSEDKIAQEYLLNREDIRECFKYLFESFNNVQLHQGKRWVIEYTGGL